MGGGTGSTRHVGHWMAYCTCPGWLWWWRIWWNEDWQGESKYSEKACHSVTLSTTNPTCQTRARTRAATVGNQRLTAWAMALPHEELLNTYKIGKCNFGKILLILKRVEHVISCTYFKWAQISLEHCNRLFLYFILSNARIPVINIPGIVCWVMLILFPRQKLVSLNINIRYSCSTINLVLLFHETAPVNIKLFQNYVTPT
jgi:hypothetical protein